MDRFAQWLFEEGYAQTSVLKIRRDVATMTRHGVSEPPQARQRIQRLEAYRWAWACFNDFCLATGHTNTLPEPPDPATLRGARRRHRKRKKRLNPAESIPADQWRALLETVELDETTEGRVIDVICSTALRIGDVLRVSRRALTKGFRREDGITVIEVKGAKPIVISVRGGPEREWTRLYDKLPTEDSLVCSAVSPRAADPRDWTANGPAYRKVLRRLKALGKEAGVEGRIYPHRLRRTVAVQAGVQGVDKFMIQKLLHHDSSRTTDIYLDETMAREVAEIAGKIRGR